MRRIVRTDDEADAAIRQFVGNKPRKARSRGLTTATVRKLAAKVGGRLDRMLKGEGTPADLVALYCLLHARVYGLHPDELAGDAWRGACSAATRMVRVEFGGDLGAAVELVRWSWAREKDWERHRRENGNGGGRLTWRRQFGAALVTDYRLDVSRRTGMG